METHLRRALEGHLYKYWRGRSKCTGILLDLLSCILGGCIRGNLWSMWTTIPTFRQAA